MAFLKKKIQTLFGLLEYDNNVDGIIMPGIRQLIKDMHLGSMYWILDEYPEVGKADFNIDHADKMNELCFDIGATLCSYIQTPRYRELNDPYHSFETVDQIITKLTERVKLDVLQLSAEALLNMGTEQADAYKADVIAYKAVIDAHPTPYGIIPCSVDTNDIFQNAEGFMEKNAVLKTIPGIDRGKQYMNLTKQCTNRYAWPAGILNVLDLCRNYWDVLQPKNLEDWKRAFPGWTIESQNLILENLRYVDESYKDSNGEGSALVDRPLGLWNYGKAFEWVLSNTEMYNHLFKLGAIFKGNTPYKDYFFLKMLAPLMKDYEWAIPYDFHLEGVTGVKVGSDDGRRAILCNNWTDKDQIISSTNFKKRIGKATRQTHYAADSWDDEDCKIDLAEEFDINILRRGVGVVKFNVPPNVTKWAYADDELN